MVLCGIDIRQIVWLAIVPLINAKQAEPACVELTDSARARLTDFVTKLAKLPSATSLALVSAEPDKETCYRRLEFRTSTGKRVTLFLSPDQRFLTTQVIDSSVDPEAAEQMAIERTKERIDEYIYKNQVPLLGPANAPITIAVFSDFQCPFCRREMRLLEKEVLPKVNARIAYLHFPLTIHPWASEAAVALACVAKEDSAAFWSIHDYVFEHQTELTPDTVAETVIDQTRTRTSASNGETIATCVHSKEMVTRIQADVDFGSSLGIAVTPTVFINGTRLSGIAGASQILEIAEKSNPKGLRIETQPQGVSRSLQ